MKKNIALVLSSGGARGFAHIGVIRTLEKNGFKITSIAGTSMGALVGGVYATGQLDRFEEWVNTLNIREILKLTDFSISNRGFLKGSKIVKKMKELVPDIKIEDLPIPYCAVATDIISGIEKVFTEGNLYDAIRASISIPTVFQPFKIGENYYMDGGIVNPVPITHVKRHEGDLLVVIDVNAQVPYVKKKSSADKKLYPAHFKQIKLLREKLSKTIPQNKKDHISIFNLTNKSIGLMVHTISALTLMNNRPDLLINISRDEFGTFDFYKAKDIIKQGELAAQEAIISQSKS
jgi:NTE family protein